MAAKNLIVMLPGQLFKTLIQKEASVVASTSSMSQEMRMYFRASAPQHMDKSYEHVMKIYRGHQVADEKYHDDIYEGRPLSHGHDHDFHEQVMKKLAI